MYPLVSIYFLIYITKFLLIIGAISFLSQHVEVSLLRISVSFPTDQIVGESMPAGQDQKFSDFFEMRRHICFLLVCWCVFFSLNLL